MNELYDQLRAILKAMKMVRWIFRVVGGVILIFALSVFVNALIERQSAVDSRDWPVVQGRVVSSDVVVASSGRTGGTHWTRYRALIEYSYEVDGASFQSMRVSFTGHGSSAGTMQSSEENAAHSVASRYPQGAEVQVFYNPRDPAETVLEPGTSNYNHNALIYSIVFLIGAIVFLLVFRRLLANMFRGAVAQQAEMYGPEIWKIAGEHGMAPPSAEQLEAVTPQPTMDMPFEASERIYWDGRWIVLEFSGCVTHSQGDFNGNLDLRVRASRPLPADILVENLRLRLPDLDELISVTAFGDVGDGFEAIFALADIVPLDIDDGNAWQSKTASSLTTVELWWGASDEKKLVTVSCVLSEEDGG